MELEEKIFELIVAKLGKTQLSDRTVRAKAARIAKKLSSESDITDEIIEDAVGDLRDIEGQYSHDVKTQVEEQLARKTGGKGPAATVDSRMSDDERRVLEEFRRKLEDLDKFKKDYEDTRRKSEEETRRKEFISKVSDFMKQSGCSDDDMRELVVLKYGVDLSKSVEDNVKSLKGEYDTRASKRVTPSPLSAVEALSSVSVASVSEKDRAEQSRADMKRIRESGPSY